MAIIAKETKKKIEIDLTGPSGNAFCLLGTARRLAKELSYSEEKIQALLKDMKSNDYQHLVKVFDDHFGDYVDLLI